MIDRDLIIVGGGPAGISAGIYGVRAELKTLIIESQVPGGQIATAGLVENYPGFPDGIRGMELSERMKAQAERAGVEFRNLEEVTSIEKKGTSLLLKTSKDEYGAKAVIVATGLKHKKLGVPGEAEFTGRGVSYCATCDGPLYRGKKVAVIGSGTSAVMAALNLHDYTEDVTMVVKGERYTVAEKIMEKRLKGSKIEIRYRTQVRGISGDGALKSLSLQDLKKDEGYEFEVDGVFIEVGKIPSTQLLQRCGVQLDDRGYVIVDAVQRTNISGLYASGDVTSNKVKQVSTAVAQGAIAALEVYRYIKGFD